MTTRQRANLPEAKGFRHDIKTGLYSCAGATVAAFGVVMARPSSTAISYPPESA